MSGRGFACVVVGKRLAAAKQRLAPVLPPAARAALAAAMFCDVVAAARRVPGMAVLVVTADRGLAALARDHGAAVIDDHAEAGIAAAAAIGAARAAAADHDGVVVLPADIPLVTPREIARLAAPASGAVLRLVAAASDRGTNALALAPIGAVPFLYGPDSFRRHRAAAGAASVAVEVLALAGCALDVDTPADLARLAARRPSGRTGALVRGWGAAMPPAAAPDRCHAAIGSAA